MEDISEIDKQFIEDFETLQERNLEARVDEVYTVSDCRHHILHSDYDAKYINIMLLINDICKEQGITQKEITSQLLIMKEKKK